MTRLHLPHPHIADTFVGHVVAGALDVLLHRALSADDLTTSAAVARWAEWKTPDQWEADQHHNEGETHA